MRLDSTLIERALVRASVGALTDDRRTCRHCHRTPLVGEVVHVYGTHSRRGEEVVCDLCRPLRAADPDRSMLVRPPESAGSVRSMPLRT